MKTPRVHSELIKAWAAGADIEFYTPSNQWLYISNPTWKVDTLYRVKAEPIIEKKFIFAEHFEQNQYYIEADIWPENSNHIGAKIIQVTLTNGKVTAVELVDPSVIS